MFNALHLWYLWFLPLALVPIILHLITLYRLRTVELSTFRFLMDSYIQQRRRVKLLEFLLMLLRTAFVALIVLTLSRPEVERFHFLTGRSGRDVTLIVDTGPSMGLRSGGTTSLERAAAAARTIVGMLNPDDHVTLIRADANPQRLAGGFAGQRQPILDQLAQLKPGIATANISGALQDALNDTPRGTRILYVLTDANRRSWAGLQGRPVTKSLGQDTQLVVMNVGPTEPVTNLAVVGDPPQALHAVAGLPVVLNATLVNTSKTKAADTTLSVFLDEQQVNQQSLSLQPGQKATRTISVTPSHSGLVRGRFELPPDAFPEDDTYLFCLNVEPKLNVLILTPPPLPAPAPPEDLFLRTAFRTPPQAQSGQTGLLEARALADALEVTSTPYNTVTDAALTAADVVILDDIPLDATLGPRLRKYVNDGGGLMIFPGPVAIPDGYNQFLLSAPALGSPPGTPADAKSIAASVGLLPPVGNPDNEAQFQPVTSLDFNHPILSAFTPSNATDYFASVRLYRYYPIRLPEVTPLHPGEPGLKPAPPGSKPGAAAAKTPLQPLQARMTDLLDAPPRPAVLMRLPDRTPVLVETRVGEGRILLAGFSAMTDWSNLPAKPAFVPMLLRAVAHLRRAPMAQVPSAVQPHEAAPITINGRWANAQVEVTDPANKPTAIALHRGASQWIGAMLQTDRKGYYNVAITPRASGVGGTSGGMAERLDLGFAVNLDSQVDFTTLSEAQLRGLVEPAPLTYLRGSADDPMLAQQLTQKREIWRTLIWVMFAVIGVEFLLSTLRAPTREQRPAPTHAAPTATGGPIRRWADRVSGALVGSGMRED